MWSNKYLLVVTETLTVAHVLKAFHKRDLAENVGSIVTDPWGRETSAALEMTWKPQSTGIGAEETWQTLMWSRKNQKLKEKHNSLLKHVPITHPWGGMQKENTWRTHHSDSFQTKSFFKLEAAYQSMGQPALASERSRRNQDTKETDHPLQRFFNWRQAAHSLTTAHPLMESRSWKGLIQNQLGGKPLASRRVDWGEKHSFNVGNTNLWVGVPNRIKQ